MKRIIALPVLLMLAGCGDEKPVAPRPSGAGWTILYSRNVPNQMTPSGATYFVDIPAIDGLHYVVRNPEPGLLGKTITMRFTIEGSGVLVPTQGEPPAKIRLFLQEAGDGMTAGEEDKRWWSVQSADLIGPGEYELIVKVEPSRWSNVFGKNGADRVPGFETCVNNLGAMGWTCGGMFAGHGIFASGGNSRLVLTEFTIA